MDMDQEIRESSGGSPSGESQGEPQQEFPRVPLEEGVEAAERAKAEFGGTYGGGGGVESEADESVAQGGPPSGEGDESESAPSGPGAVAAGTSAPSGEQQAAAQDTADEVLREKQSHSGDDASAGEKLASVFKATDSSEEGDELTTGQKAAGIMSDDEGMKWESKLVDKLSGGDDKNTSGA